MLNRSKNITEGIPNFEQNACIFCGGLGDIFPHAFMNGSFWLGLGAGGITEMFGRRLQQAITCANSACETHLSTPFTLLLCWKSSLANFR